MPIVDGKYVAPTWANGTSPAIDASELQAISDSIVRNVSSLETVTSGLNDVSDNLATFPRPNLLDNWYFVGGGSQQGGGQFPINQRGQTSYSGSGYGIDRWYTDEYGSSNSITLSSNGLSVASGVRFIQRYENVSIFDGRPACLSVLLSSGEFGFVSFPLGTNEGGLLFCNGKLVVFSLPDGRTLLRINESVTIQAVKLELGDTQTLAHQDENGNWVLNEIPDYNEELVRCMDTPPQIETGSYVGTGTYGVSNPNSLTFSFKPKMVFIKDYQSLVYGLFLSIDGLTATYQQRGYNTYDYSITSKAYAKFDGLTLTWYNTGGSTEQMNSLNTYYYTAIG